MSSIDHIYDPEVCKSVGQFIARLPAHVENRFSCVDFIGKIQTQVYLFLSKRSSFSLVGKQPRIIFLLVAPIVTMIIAVVDQRLKISNFYQAPILQVFNHGIESHWILSDCGQQFLYLLVIEKLLLSESENLEGLLLGNESSLDPQTFVGHLRPARIAELLHVRFAPFLVQVVCNFLTTLLLGQRTNHPALTLVF